MTSLVKQAAAAALLLSSSVAAQDVTTLTGTIPTSQPTACATVLTPAYSAPVAAKGWKAQLIATNLTNPRGIKFDSNGGLLVLEARNGLRHLAFDDNGGTCLSVRSSTSVIEDEEVNPDSDIP
jgi:glucose/arabinose dehydrogenase